MSVPGSSSSSSTTASLSASVTVPAPGQFSGVAPPAPARTTMDKNAEKKKTRGDKRKADDNDDDTSGVIGAHATGVQRPPKKRATQAQKAAGYGAGNGRKKASKHHKKQSEPAAAAAAASTSTSTTTTSSNAAIDVDAADAEKDGGDDQEAPATDKLVCDDDDDTDDKTSSAPAAAAAAADASDALPVDEDDDDDDPESKRILDRAGMLEGKLGTEDALLVSAFADGYIRADSESDDHAKNNAVWVQKVIDQAMHPDPKKKQPFRLGATAFVRGTANVMQRYAIPENKTAFALTEAKATIAQMQKDLQAARTSAKSFEDQHAALQTKLQEMENAAKAKAKEKEAAPAPVAAMPAAAAPVAAAAPAAPAAPSEAPLRSWKTSDVCDRLRELKEISQVVTAEAVVRYKAFAAKKAGENEQLKQKLQTALDEKAKLEKRLTDEKTALDDQLTTLRNELAGKSEKCTAFENENRTLRSHIDSAKAAQAALEAKTAECSRLQSELANVRDLRAETAVLNTQLAAQVKNATDKLAATTTDFEKERDEKEKIVKALIVDVAKAKGELAAANAELVKERDQKTKLEASLAASSAHAAKAKDDLLVANKTIEQVSARCTRLTEGLRKSREARDRAENEFRIAKRRFEKMEEGLCNPAAMDGLVDAIKAALAAKKTADQVKDTALICIGAIFDAANDADANESQKESTTSSSSTAAAAATTSTAGGDAGGYSHFARDSVVNGNSG